MQEEFRFSTGKVYFDGCITLVSKIELKHYEYRFLMSK